MAHNNKNGIYKRNSLDEWTCCGKANEKRIKNSYFSSCNIARRLICISNNSQQSVVWGWWVSDVMRWFIGVYRGVKQKTTKEPRMRLCLLLSSLLLRQQWMIPCGNNVMIPWRVFWIIIKQTTKFCYRLIFISTKGSRRTITHTVIRSLFHLELWRSRHGLVVRLNFSS